VTDHEDRGTAIYDWQRLRKDKDGHYTILPDMAIWIGSVIASGVIGNAAYDVLKAKLLEFRANHKVQSFEGMEAPGAMGLYELRYYMDYVAKMAVINQCEKHELPVPGERDLRVESWYRKKVDGALVREATVVAAKGSIPFSAHVRLPVHNAQTGGIQVRIVQAVTWEFDPPRTPFDPTFDYEARERESRERNFEGIRAQQKLEKQQQGLYIDDQDLRFFYPESTED
jgi:hypothetical protein